MNAPFVPAPFGVQPRLDTKPWGGSRLVAYGFARPAGADEPLGEVLVSADQSVITDGPYGGQSLGHLTARYHDEVAGPLGRRVTGGRVVFPLLIKLIDAAANLSIQVHPDDDQAAAAGSNGKTEAWYILDALAGSQLYLGLADGNAGEFLDAGAIGDGSSARLLRTAAARVGQTVVLPAGTVHALGAGVMVYEVQQPSEITYRLDDWGRVGVDGRPRERHLAAGGRAIRAHLRPTPASGVDLGSPSGERLLLAACRYFALERITLREDDRITATTSGSPQIVTVISGEAIVGTGDEAVRARLGGSVVVPAALPAVSIAGIGPVTVLRSWIPDLPREIIDPARQAGTPDTVLANLGVFTP